MNMNIANRIRGTQASEVAQSSPSTIKPQNGVTLLGVKPLQEGPVAGASVEEASKTFRQILDQNQGHIQRLSGVDVAVLEPLKAVTAELLSLDVSYQLSGPQLKNAAQALSFMDTALSMFEPHFMHEFSPNHLAQTLTMQASNMEKMARTLAKDTELKAMGELLQNTAQGLRTAVQENYLESGSIEAYSLKEAANFRALHYEAGIQTLDGLLAKLHTGPQSPDVKAQIEGLEKYKSELQTQADNYKSEWFQNNSDKATDAKKLKKLMGGTLHKMEPKKIVDFLKGKIYVMKHQKSALENAGKHGKPMPDHTGVVHLKTALAAHMHGRLKSLGFDKADIPSLGKLREKIGDSYKEGVQKQPWKNIDRQHSMFQVNASGQFTQASFENKITRAKDLSPELRASYQADGLEGVSSLSNKEDKHVVNMWKTEFKGPGGFNFSAIRHGIHDAYKLHGSEARAAANDTRVKEFIEASIQASPERIQRDKDGNLTFNIISVSLVTPGIAGGEDKMLNNQVAAYQRANQKFGKEGIEVNIPQPDGSFKTERVKPHVIAFNTGVNSFSLGKLGPLVGGWGPSDKLNNASLKTMMGEFIAGDELGGMVGDKLKELRSQLNNPAMSGQQQQIQKKIDIITDISYQIRDIMTASHLSDQSHHKAGNEPYKLPTRLAALANEIGSSPAFNCKSGKDRTGQLDVEIKDFYTHLNLSEGKPREVGHKRNEAEKLNFKNLFEFGGGREVQKYNTGVPGSKVDLKMFYNELQFKSDKVDQLKGLSKWVGA